MNFIKITSEEKFISELDNCYNYLLNEKLSQGVLEIRSRLNEIYDIVHNKKTMKYYQKGYSYLRPFVDNYQDSIDFFETDFGTRVKQVFYYFAYKFQVPEIQLGGYNIDENFIEDSNL